MSLEEQKPFLPIFCDVCGVKFEGTKDATVHFTSPKHFRKHFANAHKSQEDVEASGIFLTDCIVNVKIEELLEQFAKFGTIRYVIAQKCKANDTRCQWKQNGFHGKMKIFYENSEITQKILKQRCKFNGKNLRIIAWNPDEMANHQQKFLTDEEIEKIAIKVTFAQVRIAVVLCHFLFINFFSKGQGKFGRN